MRADSFSAFADLKRFSLYPPHTHTACTVFYRVKELEGGAKNCSLQD